MLKNGVPEETDSSLDLLGFSSIANLLMSIKMAKYYELGDEDVVLTVFTDSMELYGSRLKEMHAEHGEYTEVDAAANHAQYLHGQTTDHLQELTYADRRRVHNLKYYTWVEQQGKTYEEIMDQWHERDYWVSLQNQIEEIDELIEDFNHRTGLIGQYQ